jgi:hypothetical protein
MVGLLWRMCSKFWKTIVKNSLRNLICLYLFVRDAFTICCLLHSLLRSQIETNVKRLKKIIAMELQQNLITYWCCKKKTSHSIDGERFGEAMHTQLNINFGWQWFFTWLSCLCKL